MLIGNPNATVVRVRSTLNYRTIHVGDTSWVTGDGVQAMIAANILVPI